VVQATLLTYGSKRYLWGSVIGAVALLLSYSYYAQTTIPSGSTVWGLVYGWMGLIAILVLMFLGIRKRWYFSRLGTLQGWTSAHVYLGFLTLLIIPMHAGFQFGWDVHTLAYVLLVVVALSGLVGLRIYLTVPMILTLHERGMLPETLEAEINQILKEMKQLAADKLGIFQHLYQEEVSRCSELKSQGWRILFTPIDPNAILAQRTHDLHKQLADVPATDQEGFSRFVGLVMRKTELEAYLAGQMRLKNELQAWLYVHVPVSIAMVAAVGIHLLAVLYY
jgi:cytochrome b561